MKEVQTCLAVTIGAVVAGFVGAALAADLFGARAALVAALAVLAVGLVAVFL